MICQTLASTTTPMLLKHGHALPYIVSMICCLLAYAVTIVLTSADTPENTTGPEQRMLRAPLLPPAEGDNTGVSYMKQVQQIFHIFGDKSTITRSTITLLGLIFFTAAVSKATRPLFMTYIQHRVGITPEEVSIDESNCIYGLRVLTMDSGN